MKTLKVTDEKLCIGCQLCVLACSRKLGKGVSIQESYIRVTPIGDNHYKVLIDQGKMTEELALYIAPVCPVNILEVTSDNA